MVVSRIPSQTGSATLSSTSDWANAGYGIFLTEAKNLNLKPKIENVFSSWTRGGRLYGGYLIDILDGGIRSADLLGPVFTVGYYWFATAGLVQGLESSAVGEVA